MATLTTTITENLSLNGSQQGGTRTKTITGINHVFKRIVTCVDDSDCTIASFQTATHTADNAIDLEDVRYIRITNLEASHPCNLSLQVAGGEDGSANMSSSHLLQASESFILHVIHDGIAVKDDAATIVTALTDLESLLIDPLSENVKVEVFIASV
tara:strand:+ start:1871 stop:2338 length:468 start_codon:yes stop_codon:yes gene_type:complete